LPIFTRAAGFANIEAGSQVLADLSELLKRPDEGDHLEAADRAAIDRPDGRSRDGSGITRH
jgi:hypothetical protein